MAPLVGEEFCFAHSPTRAKERAQARRTGGHNRRTPSGTPPEPGTVRLRDVQSIQQEMEREFANVLLQENSERRTRAVATLLSLALRTLEVGEFEQRLAAIEQRLANVPPSLRRVG